MDEFWTDLADEIDMCEGYSAEGFDFGEIFVTAPDGRKFIITGNQVDKFPTED